MKTFKFPLESLRTLRKQREHAAQQRYAQALTACNSAAGRLQLAEEELKAAHATFQSELASGTVAIRIVNLKTWCNVLESRRNDCAKSLAEARHNANEAFRAMAVAVREREALDRFHDKCHNQWQRACQADEQKMFDELAIQRQATGSVFEQSILN